MLGTRPSAALQSRIEWWSRLIARQQSSHVTVTQFCHQVGITPRAFYYWRERLREAHGFTSTPCEKAPESPLRETTPARGATASFVPVSVVSPAAAGELTVELTNGCAVLLRGAVDPSLLQAAIAAAAQLDGPGRGGC
jgi:transposase-like protein